MPSSKRSYPPMSPVNMGKMAISSTHNFIMDRARAVGNIPSMKRAHAPSSAPGTKKSPMQGKPHKMATGGPSNMKVAGSPFNKKKPLTAARAPVMKGAKPMPNSPGGMSKGPFRPRTLGEPEFGQYQGGTGKRGSA